MSEVAERYARLAAAFNEKVATAPGGRWESPSTCDGGTARDALRHVVEAQGLFLGFLGRRG